MHTLHPFLAALPLLVCACYVPDVDALDRHLRQTCDIPFAVPACAGDPAAAAAARRIGVERFSAHVESPEEERCVLAVDCSEERRAEAPEGIVDAVVDCVADGVAVDIDQPELAECMQHCSAQLRNCGEGSLACGERAAVEACIDVYEGCLGACSQVYGNSN